MHNHRQVAEGGLNAHTPLLVKVYGEESEPALKGVVVAHPHCGNLPPVVVPVLEGAAVARTTDEAAHFERHGVVGLHTETLVGLLAGHHHIAVPHRQGAGGSKLQVVGVAPLDNPRALGAGEPFELTPPLGSLNLVPHLAAAKVVARLAVVHIGDVVHQQSLRALNHSHRCGVQLKALDRLVGAQTVEHKVAPTINEQRGVGAAGNLATHLPQALVGLGRAHNLHGFLLAVAVEFDEVHIVLIGSHCGGHITTIVECSLLDLLVEKDVFPIYQVVRHPIPTNVVGGKEVVFVLEVDHHGVGRCACIGVLGLEGAPTIVQVNGVAVGCGIVVHKVATATAQQQRCQKCKTKSFHLCCLYLYLYISYLLSLSILSFV